MIYQNSRQSQILAKIIYAIFSISLFMGWLAELIYALQYLYHHENPTLKTCILVLFYTLCAYILSEFYALTTVIFGDASELKNAKFAYLIRILIMFLYAGLSVLYAGFSESKDDKNYAFMMAIVFLGNAVIMIFPLGIINCWIIQSSVKFKYLPIANLI